MKNIFSAIKSSINMRGATPLIVCLMVFGVDLYGAEIHRAIELTSKESMISSKIYKNNLYVSNSRGEVEIYRIFNDKKLQPKYIKSLKLENIKNFYNESNPPRVYGVDVNDKEILALSEDSDGGKKLALYDGKTLKLKKILFSLKDNLPIKKAVFVDGDRILLGLFSSEIIMYDMKNKIELWHIKLSSASLSDIALSNDKKILFATGESGYVHVIDAKDGNIKYVFKDINKDNNYQIAYGESNAVARLVTAGQDRKMGIYSVESKSMQGIKADFIRAEFLVYSVGISHDGKIAAMQSDENGNISVYDLSNKAKIHTLKGNTALLNTIHFLDGWVCATNDDRGIYFWKIPK